ncbi:hypothetical protein PORY_001724 [Pneumocystis oryctolagi]|uniref:Uncharacterized protein n=1 Tax=Pneumocystis oryctolagi TaxID=42067 RepID=A0ACB7CBE2_9ASCO|nr:hypothetical protein PORY_001724 [Pneumocystis oryctolagi]
MSLNSDLKANEYCISSCMNEDLETVLSGIDAKGIKDNENTCNFSEILDDNQILLSDDCHNNGIYGEKVEAKNLEEFVEILEKKKHDSFLKIGTSKEISYQVPNDHVKLFGDRCVNNTASKRLSLSEMITSLRTSSITNSYLKSFHEESVCNFSSDTLSAPLAKPIQDRLDREVAYDIVKKELEKWKNIVKFNRESGTLKFPLNPLKKIKLTNNLLSAKFQASTPFEKSIDSVLQSSCLKNESSAFEKLPSNKFSIKDIETYHAELRLMRDLMFRQGCKGKRISKIKSKSYRRVRRCERKKIKSLILNEMDCDELRLQKEIKRAKERMSLRHSNASKCVEEWLACDFLNTDSTQFISEQSRDKQLKRRIQDIHSSDSEGLDNVDENNITNDKGSLMNLMKFSECENSKLSKDLMNIQFLKSFKNENNGILNEVSTEKDNEILCCEYDNDKKNECFSNSTGRKIFNPSLRKICIPDINDKHIEISKIRQSLDLVDKKSSCFIQSSKDPDMYHEKYNPWLSISYESPSNLDGLKLNHNVKYSMLRESDEDYKKDNQFGLHIDLSEELFSTNTIEQNKCIDDIDKRNINMIYNGSMFSLKYKDLVTRAFSGDNVVEKFEEEKYKEIKESVSCKKDITMPGWGSWYGIGVKCPSKKLIKKTSDVLEKDRKDTGLKNVVITEKRIKKNTRLLVPSIPYPYLTKEQYERSLMLPFGPEWITRRQYQKLISPRIIIKQGSIIEPLKISS